MPHELTKKDYISILKFYKQPIPKSLRLLQKQAEQIMAQNARLTELHRENEYLQNRIARFGI